MPAYQYLEELSLVDLEGYLSKLTTFDPSPSSNDKKQLATFDKNKKALDAAEYIKDKIVAFAFSIKNEDFTKIPKDILTSKNMEKIQLMIKILQAFRDVNSYGDGRHVQAQGILKEFLYEMANAENQKHEPVKKEKKQMTMTPEAEFPSAYDSSEESDSDVSDEESDDINALLREMEKKEKDLAKIKEGEEQKARYLAQAGAEEIENDFVIPDQGEEREESEEMRKARERKELEAAREKFFAGLPQNLNGQRAEITENTQKVEDSVEFDLNEIEKELEALEENLKAQPPTQAPMPKDHLDKVLTNGEPIPEFVKRNKEAQELLDEVTQHCQQTLADVEKELRNRTKSKKDTPIAKVIEKVDSNKKTSKKMRNLVEKHKVIQGLLEKATTDNQGNNSRHVDTLDNVKETFVKSNVLGVLNEKTDSRLRKTMRAIGKFFAKPLPKLHKYIASRFFSTQQVTNQLGNKLKENLGKPANDILNPEKPEVTESKPESKSPKKAA